MDYFANQIGRLSPGRLVNKGIGVLAFTVASRLFFPSLPDEPQPPTRKMTSGVVSPATDQTKDQTKKFSWVIGEDKTPVFETNRLEDVHGVRVPTALHALAAMGPDDPRKNKFMKIMKGGLSAPIYPTVREIAKDLGL